MHDVPRHARWPIRDDRPIRSPPGHDHNRAHNNDPTPGHDHNHNNGPTTGHHHNRAHNNDPTTGHDHNRAHNNNGTLTCAIGVRYPIPWICLM